MSELQPASADGRDADALRAAACLAVDPRGIGGAVLHTDSGDASERWLECFRGALPESEPVRRVPAHVEEERLFGGTDLAATLRTGRMVFARGVLAETDGGVIVLSMAERLSARMAACIGTAMDHGAIEFMHAARQEDCATRFGVIALDGGREPDERCPAALRERLGMHLDLQGLTFASAHPATLTTSPAPVAGRGAIDAARARLALIVSDESALRALCATAAACGIDSLRAPWYAWRVACAHAALAGRDQVQSDDLQFAVRVVLAPRATVDPNAQSQSPPPPPPPESSNAQEQQPSTAAPSQQPKPPQPPQLPEQSQTSAQSDPQSNPESPDTEAKLDDQLIQAARASIPAGLLAQLADAQFGARRQSAPGRAGAAVMSRARGRPAGVRAGRPRQGTRLNILATLRSAAPWQRLRRVAAADQGARVRVCVSDFRVTWYRQRTQTVTIFVLDASGSSALHRLAEAKGAVELLLAECYVRRDQVAVLVFRGKGAEVVLAPTRSLLRAKRSLGAMPGGGATPLAAGLDAARALVEQVLKRGQSPSLVLLTDGQANVARDGTGGRQRAADDAMLAARDVRALGVKTLLIDTAPRPQPQGRRLAEALQGRYLPLPNAEAHSLAAAIKNVG